MPDRRLRHVRAGHQRGYRWDAAAQEAIIAKEQATRGHGEPDAGEVTEDDQRSNITLKNGAEVNARAAVAIVQDLRGLLAVDPDEFHTLLALAEGRPGDANPEHFPSLGADEFLEQDGHTIRPVVRDVLLNCYEVTTEGPVVTPLRLQSEADLPAAMRAQEQLDRQLRNLLSGDEGKHGWSRD